MKKLKLAVGLMSLFLTAPIWYYLLHWMLVASNAGDLQMFLFWVYVPLAFVLGIISAVARSTDED